MRRKLSELRAKRDELQKRLEACGNLHALEEIARQLDHVRGLITSFENLDNDEK